jgi:hypothetical protein
MFSRAAVSRYPVNKFGTGRLFAAFLARIAASADFPVTRKTKNKKAGMEAGLLQLTVEED